MTEDGHLSKDAFEVVNENVVGAFWDAEIWRYNRGGVIVMAGDCKGFLPYTMMDTARLEGVIHGPDNSVDASVLLGQKIKCIVKRVRCRSGGWACPIQGGISLCVCVWAPPRAEFRVFSLLESNP